MAGLYIETTPQGIFCIGDSMTYNWAVDLAELLPERFVVGRGVGGTNSAAQVSRVNGVSITYPLDGQVKPDNWTTATDTINAGTVNIQLRRVVEKNTYYGSVVESYRSQWVERAQQISNPSRVEVFNNGQKIGDATHHTMEVTTDYATDNYKLYRTAHGLANGDFLFLWMQDANRPARSELSYWQSPQRPENLTEYKAYTVTNATADSFEIVETDLAGTRMDLGSDATGTLICETGWSLDWDYDGGAWDLSIRTRSDISDHIWICQTTTNDVLIGTPDNSYERWGTHTLPAIEYLLDNMLSHPKRFIYVIPTLSAYDVTGGVGSANWIWINDVVRPWANARALVDPNFLVVDPYQLSNAPGVRLAEELALLANPAVAELLWIRGNPHAPSSWEAFTADQGDTFRRWVGHDFLPLHFRSGNDFNDSGHYDDDDGAQFVAASVRDAIINAGF